MEAVRAREAALRGDCDEQLKAAEARVREAHMDRDAIAQDCKTRVLDAEARIRQIQEDLAAGMRKWQEESVRAQELAHQHVAEVLQMSDDLAVKYQEELVVQQKRFNDEAAQRKQAIEEVGQKTVVAAEIEHMKVIEAFTDADDRIHAIRIEMMHQLNETRRAAEEAVKKTTLEKEQMEKAHRERVRAAEERMEQYMRDQELALMKRLEAPVRVHLDISLEHMLVSQELPIEPHSP